MDTDVNSDSEAVVMLGDPPPQPDISKPASKITMKDFRDMKAPFRRNKQLSNMEYKNSPTLLIRRGFFY
jgi:hypothetical protein